MPKPGPRTTYRYSDEFKSTAVRLSELAGVEVQDEVFLKTIIPSRKAKKRDKSKDDE